MRSGWARDLALVALGAVGGYWFAVSGRVKARALPLGQAANLPARIEDYYHTHPNEVIVGAALVAVIVWLAWGKRPRPAGSVKSRR